MMSKLAVVNCYWNILSKKKMFWPSEQRVLAAASLMATAVVFKMAAKTSGQLRQVRYANQNPPSDQTD
jgi:P pilus assembly chaperone PapD